MAHGLGIRIALGAHPIGIDLRALALFLERRDPGLIQHEATARKIAHDARQIGTQQFRINHVEPFSSVFSSVFLARRRAKASPMRISSPRGAGR